MVAVTAVEVEVVRILSPPPRSAPAAAAPAGIFRLAPVPFTQGPSLFLPVRYPAAAATAVRRWCQGSGYVQAAAGRAAAVGVQNGMLRLAFVRTLDVGDDGADGPPALVRHLSALLGRELTVAVRMRPGRPNSKPVLMLLSPVGELLAYAKVGTNSLTRGLVRNEAAVLADLARDDRRGLSFDVPTVLHSGRWQDLEILVVSPLQVSARSRRDPAPSAMREIAARRPLDLVPLRGSTYWRETVDRVGNLPAEQTGAQQLRTTAGRVTEAVGDSRVLFGTWHGDWTPENLRRTGERYSVWDWERSTAAAPVGLDAAYFLVGAERHRRPLNWSTLGALTRRVAPLATDLGQASRHAGLLVLLALLETALRFEEARAVGIDVCNRTLPLLPVACGLVREPVPDRGSGRAGGHAR